MNDDNAASAPLPPEPPADDSLARDVGATVPEHFAADDHPAASPSSPSEPAGSDDLLSIKQQALQQLTPLVGHLDQTPEEKFRTTMMMIQGSDDKSLINDAYSAAQQITDEKARAQALLDVVNEINYFTQHNPS